MRTYVSEAIQAPREDVNVVPALLKEEVSRGTADALIIAIKDDDALRLAVLELEKLASEGCRSVSEPAGVSRTKRPALDMLQGDSRCGSLPGACLCVRRSSSFFTCGLGI